MLEIRKKNEELEMLEKLMEEAGNREKEYKNTIFELELDKEELESCKRYMEMIVELYNRKFGEVNKRVTDTMECILKTILAYKNEEEQFNGRNENCKVGVGNDSWSFSIEEDVPEANSYLEPMAGASTTQFSSERRKMQNSDFEKFSSTNAILIPNSDNEEIPEELGIENRPRVCKRKKPLPIIGEEGKGNFGDGYADQVFNQVR